ncbi:HAMP domain-containing sensor histidine kinase [Salinibacterium sp.]|uniref:sensor histidine kinase n=1 Tax=Salinibacterium sp. TaxID=1915057 RepID=UPI00286A2199|nr:HAMP domain-containing sensor histidine kinase [Salinibacterium sp.]
MRDLVAGIRARITVIATVVVIAVLGAAAIALATTQRSVLTDSVDEVLTRHAAEILQSWPYSAVDATIPGQGDDESFALLSDPGGKLLASTASPPELRTPPQPAAGSVTYTTVSDPSTGIQFRVRSERAGELVVQVGTPLDDVNDSVDALARGLAVSVPVTAALLALTVWFLVGRVLHPVEAIRAQVADIQGDTLDRRVPEPRTRDEIGRLAATMNGMLDRVQDASVRQRRFVDDASHELRTPLARIRTELEIDLAHPETADAARTTQRVLSEVLGLQQLVDDLLAMARSDRESEPPSATPVDLDDIVFTVVDSLRASHPDVTIRTAGVSAARTYGSRAQLARVVTNVLDNARIHGRAPIDVTLHEHEERVVLTVTDSGPGIRPADAERVFNRFVRLDDARTPSASNTGLGLSIVRSILTVHRGTIAIDTTHAPGASFVVTLPLCRD